MLYVTCVFQINYSELSRRFGLSDQTKLGGMVVKQVLQKEGIDVSRFRTMTRTPVRAARRRLKRMPGSEVTVPVPPTNDIVREAIKVNLPFKSRTQIQKVGAKNY